MLRADGFVPAVEMCPQSDIASNVRRSLIVRGAIMRDRVLVPFSGLGEGVEVLSWGQRGLWQTTLNEGKSVTMAGLIQPPAGTTVQALVEALQFAIGRHQTLRTRLRFEEDGSIRQVVSSSGTTSMEL